MTALSWKDDFLQKLVEISQSDARLASAKLRPRKLVVTFEHAQMRSVGCEFSGDRLTGSRQLLHRERGSTMRFLEREHDRIEIEAEEWAKVLLTLEDWGWQPEPGMRMALLARGVVVSADVAVALSTAGQQLLDAALADPLSAYPIPASMDKVYEVVEFCKAGEFRITE